MNRRLRYLRDRVVNAWWMLRRGELKSMLRAAFLELKHRVESVQAWWYRRRKIDFSKIPGSAYADSRKVCPPSYRPTVSRRLTEVPLEADAQVLAAELAGLRDSFDIPVKGG
ncbi:MAG: hypothetical protein CME59_04355 [Halioglobus sp.]|nr:hypothetical protein [Halioglobus sp.]|tara:strand:- start:618 stop:953 length:336 start_codon:yes stop_codon:yes gene_type:complete